MLDFIVAPVIVATICFFIYRVFELFTRRKERILMVERMSNFSIQGNLHIPDSKLLISTSGGQFTALKIGLMFVGIGIGLVAALCFADGLPDNCTCLEKYTYHKYNCPTKEKIFLVYLAFLSIFGGLGLLSAFILERNMTKKDSQE